MTRPNSALLSVAILSLLHSTAWAGYIPAGQAVTPATHPFGIEIQGAPSERRDDAPSTVTCPANMYAVQCFCKDTSNCDGAIFESTTTCKVFNAANARVPSTAVAVCSAAENFAAARAVKVELAEGTNMFCPFGTVMSGCAVNDPWSQSRVIGVVNDFLSCVWVKLSGSRRPNPTMTAQCVTPQGPLFLGPPTDKPGPPTFGSAPGTSLPVGIELKGPASSRGQAPSTVSCPENSFARECRCKDESNCEGAMWESPRTCTVTNAAHQTVPSKAVVKCIPRHEAGDIFIARGENIEQGEKISCPEGFGMRECAIHDPWPQLRRTRVVTDGTSCHWENLSLFTRRNPTLTALCTKPRLLFGHLFAQSQPLFTSPVRDLPFFGPPRGIPKCNQEELPFFGPIQEPAQNRPSFGAVGCLDEVDVFPHLGPEEDIVNSFPDRSPIPPPQGPDPSRPSPPNLGPHPRAISLRGNRTELADNAPSTVSCPANTFAVTCRCKDYTNCDGSTWDSPTTCTVRNAAGATVPSIPMVSCVPLHASGDVKIVRGQSIAAEQTISCPAGERMAGCAINDPWSHVRQTTVVNDGSNCYWKKFSGSASRNPSLTALCVKDPTLFDDMFGEQIGTTIDLNQGRFQGQPMKVGEAAPATVTCPANTFVARCFSRDSMNSEGAMFASPTTCTAQMSAHSSIPATAIALCVEAGLFIDARVVTGQVASGQKIFCPPGYGMNGCALNDPYTENRIAGVVFNYQSCLWAKLSGSEKPNPTLTANCFKPKPRT